MAWFKVDDGFHSSRKLMRIPRQHRLEAAGLWVISGSWSAQEELDGLVPDYMLDEWGAKPDSVEWLIKCGLWESHDGGAQFTNWGEYQPTKAELEEGRTRERERKAAWRKEKARRDAERKAEMSQRDNQGTEVVVPAESALTRPDPTRPDPTRPDPTPSESKDSSGGGAPPRKCKRHDHWEHVDRCGPCGQDRRAQETYDAEQARLAAEAKREAQRNPTCPHGFPRHESCERCGDSWPG